MSLGNVRSPEPFGIDPWFVPTLCSPMHLVVGFNGSIAGAVTAIEGVIGEIPICNIFIRRVLTPSDRKPRPLE